MELMLTNWENQKKVRKIIPKSWFNIISFSGATTKLSKLNVWMKKQGKCFQCVSKQPLVIHLEEYESYKLVEK